MVFCYGKCPMFSLTYSGQELEVVKSFIYLGFTFTVNLTFTPHLLSQVTKARSRVGQLFARLPLVELPLSTVLCTFETYLTPLFLYGLPLWISNCSRSSLQSLDALFTKFLKRYLGLKPWVRSAIVYFITEMMSYSNYLRAKSLHTTKSLIFPNCLSGLKLSILEHHETVEYWPIPLIEPTFWASRTFSVLPSSYFYRKKLITEIFDHEHLSICRTTKFHPHAQNECICKYCNGHAHPYHVRVCKSIVQ